MAVLAGTTVAGPIVTPTDADTFATHYAKYGNGGWQAVDSVEKRDAIPFKRLEKGMAVYVVDEKQIYICTTLTGDEKSHTIKWTPFEASSDYTTFEVLANNSTIEHGSVKYGDISFPQTVINDIPACMTETFYLKLNEPCSVRIDWGDGTNTYQIITQEEYEETEGEPKFTHTYTVEGLHKVRIFGNKFIGFYHKSSDTDENGAVQNLVYRILEEDLPLAVNHINFQNCCIAAARLLQIQLPSWLNNMHFAQMLNAFNSCKNLVVVKGSAGARIPAFVNCKSVFEGCTSLISSTFRIPPFATLNGAGNNVGNVGRMYFDCYNLNMYIDDLLPYGGFTQPIVDLAAMFGRSSTDYVFNTLKARDINYIAERLWNNRETTFMNYGDFALYFNDDVRKLFPQEWGGKNKDIKIVPRKYDPNNYTSWEVLRNSNTINVGDKQAVNKNTGEVLATWDNPIAVAVGYDTTKESFQVCVADTKSFYVDWGDGKSNEYAGTAATDKVTCEHTYSPGLYEIRVYGDNFYQIIHSSTNNLMFAALGYKHRLSNNHVNLSEFCAGAMRLTKIVLPKWFDFSKIEALASTFSGCKNLITVEDDGMMRLTSITTVAKIFENCENMTTCQFRLPPLVCLDNNVSDGYRYAFYHCYKLTGNIEDFFPMEGFAGSKIDLTYLFRAEPKLTFANITGTVPAWMLWEDTSKTFVGAHDVSTDITTNLFGRMPEAIRAQVPPSWGGTNSEIVVPTRTNKEYVDAGLASKQDTLTAGTNIEINNNVISTKATANYTAWEVLVNTEAIPVGRTSYRDITLPEKVEVEIPVGTTELFKVWQFATGKVVVDWGDGTIEEKECIGTDASTTPFEHTYSEYGKYIVKVYGDKFCRITHPEQAKNLLCRVLEKDLPLASGHNCLQYFAQNALRLQTVNVHGWFKETFIASMNYTFSGCQNLITVSGLNRLSIMGSCQNIFEKCYNLTTCDFRLPATMSIGGYSYQKANGNNGYRNIYSDATKVTTDIGDLLPVYGFTSEVVDLNGIFSRSGSGTVTSSFDNVTLKNYEDVANKLWNDTSRVFLNYGSFALYMSNTVRQQIPTSWGGLNDTIVVPTRTNKEYVDAHANNSDIHVTTTDKTKWNTHVDDSTKHVSDITCVTSLGDTKGDITLGNGLDISTDKQLSVKSASSTVAGITTVGADNGGAAAYNTLIKKSVRTGEYEPNNFYIYVNEHGGLFSNCCTLVLQNDTRSSDIQMYYYLGPEAGNYVRNILATETGISIFVENIINNYSHEFSYVSDYTEEGMEYYPTYNGYVAGLNNDGTLIGAADIATTLTSATNHINNPDIHVTADNKTAWTAKADISDITSAISDHSTDTTVHANKQDKLSTDTTISIDSNNKISATGDFSNNTVKAGVLQVGTLKATNTSISLDSDINLSGKTLSYGDVVIDSTNGVINAKNIVTSSGHSLNDKQNKLTAGYGIDITNNVISSTDDTTEYLCDDYTAFDVYVNKSEISTEVESYEIIRKSTGVAENVLANEFNEKLKEAIPAGNVHTMTLKVLGISDIKVDWGDGTSDTCPVSSQTPDGSWSISHTYDNTTEYIYTVKVYGGFSRIIPTAGKNLTYRVLEHNLPLAATHVNLQKFANNSPRLIRCKFNDQMQTSKIANMTSLFANCKNLVQVGEYIESENDKVGRMDIFTNALTISSMFEDCINLRRIYFKFPTLLSFMPGTSSGGGYRRVFINNKVSMTDDVWQLTCDLNDLFPDGGFAQDIVDITSMFYVSSSSTYANKYPNITLTETSAATLAKKLWLSGKTFIGYENIFKNMSQEVRAYIPESWGGTLSDDIIPIKTSQQYVDSSITTAKADIKEFISKNYTTKFKVMLTSGTRTSAISSDLLNEIVPSLDESGTPIPVYAAAAPYHSDVEAFVLQLTTSLSDSDVIIDFGDGTEIKLKNYTDGISSETSTLLIHHVTENNTLLIAHKYANGWIKLGTQSTVVTSVYYRDTIVTISGKDYTNISGKVDGIMTPSSTGSFKSIIGYYDNRIIDLLTDELPIAKQLTNLSYMLNDDRIIRKINASASQLLHQVVNLSYFANNAYNLNYVYGFKALSPVVETIKGMFYNCNKLIDTDITLPSVYTDVDAGMQYLFYNCVSLAVDISKILPENGFIADKICIYKAFANCINLTGSIPDDIFWGKINNTFTDNNGNVITNALTQVFTINNNSTAPAICKDMMPIWCNTEYVTKIRIKFTRPSSGDLRNQIQLHLTEQYTDCDVIISMTNGKNNGFILSKSTPDGADFRCTDGVTCLFELRFYNYGTFLNDTDYAEFVILGKQYDHIYASGNCNNIYEALTPDLPVASHLTNFSYLFADSSTGILNKTCCENLVIGDWFDDSKTYNFTRAFAKCTNLKSVTGFKNIKNITGTNIFQYDTALESVDYYNTRNNPLVSFDQTIELTEDTTINLNQNTKLCRINMANTSSVNISLAFSYDITDGISNLRNGMLHFQLWFYYKEDPEYTDVRSAMIIGAVPTSSGDEVKLYNTGNSAVIDVFYNGTSFYINKLFYA